ncbi:MAG: TRAP transporter substrate-binding protein DctP [Thermodesulfobacteriota bacterium]
MVISNARSGINLPRVFLSVFIALLISIMVGPTVSAAADAGRQGFQTILVESLTALWTGQEFSPELKQRQETLKAMLASGAVPKSEMETMTEETISSILDRHKTSRYILKDFPTRASALFAPQMTWDEIKQIIWRAMTSPVKKEDPVLFKVGTLAPPGTPWLTVPETIAFPEIERLSEGRVLMKIYGGGVMGEDTDILRKMDMGQLDSCGCTSLGVLAASPDTSAFLVPGLFKNYEEVDYICEKFRKRLDEGFEKKGYILAALIDTGFFYMFSKNKITGLADLRKQKVLTWFGAMETALYKELSINPTPVAVPEIVSTLSTGLADTNLSPAGWMLGMQAYQYSKYFLKPALLYSPAAVIVSTKTKERLRKQINVSETYAHNVQELLVFEFNSIEPEWRRQIRAYEGKSLEAFESKCGIKVMTFSFEDQQAIEKAGESVQRQMAGKAFSADLIVDIKKALEEYRAKH